MRRQIGPTAWSVLEILASRIVDDDGRAVAPSSVRDVADALGTAKNTAHRALQSLIAAGLAVPEQRRKSDGRFLPGVYLLAIPFDVLRLAPPELTAPNAPISRRVTRSTRTRDVIGIQLDLLTNCD